MPEPSPRSLATAVAAGRVAIGFGALLAPDRVVRGLARSPQSGPPAPYLTRLAGSRDVALGAATLLAAGTARRDLVVAGAAVDMADAAAGALAVRRGEVGPVVGAALTVLPIAAVAAAYLALRRGPLGSPSWIL